MKEQMTISNETRIKEIYQNLKSDLTLCIKFMRKKHPENVEAYFWTLERDEIEKQLQVICKPFSYVQQVQIGKVISDLHTFISSYHEEWQTKNSKKLSKKKSKSLNEKTTSEA